MRNTLPFLLAMIFGPSSLFTQSLTFHRIYDPAHYNDARGIIATDDGCLVFTGLSKGPTDSLGDMYLTKVNAAGAVLWTQYYGRDKEDGSNSLLATSDGGYLLTGHTALSYGRDCDGYLVKTDAKGKEQWRALVGAAYDDVCFSSVQLADGSYLITGRTENADTHTFQVMLAKVAADGRPVFLKALETERSAVGYKIVPASDGNFLIAGYSYSDSQPFDVLVLKCTPDGAVLWQTNWGTDLDDRAYSVLPLKDGSLVAVGASVDTYGQPAGRIMLRLDFDGTLLATNESWATSQPGGLYDILLNEANQIVVAGVISTDKSPQTAPAIGIMDLNFNASEWRTGNFQSSCRTRAMTRTSTDDYVLAGNIQDDLLYGSFLSKISGDPASSGVKELTSEDFLLFPNPFSEFTYLKIGNSFQSKVLTITTLDGKEIRRTSFTTPELLIYREHLAVGNYIFSVADSKGNLMTTGKISVK